MGTLVDTKHELLSKKTEVMFRVPEKNLIRCEDLLTGGKPFYNCMKVPKTKGKPTRKDLPANWDAVF